MVFQFTFISGLLVLCYLTLTELNYGINLPKGYHRSDEEHDWEKPAQIHKGQIILGKHDHLGQISAQLMLGEDGHCLPGFPHIFLHRDHNSGVKHRLGST